MAALQHVRFSRQRTPYYVTVQSAMNAARPGDWILVYPGVYHEKSKQWPTAGVLVGKPRPAVRAPRHRPDSRLAG
jgi:hypothetical protein